MLDDNYGFRDDDERKAFYIALPVIALFGGLAYNFVFASHNGTDLDTDATSTAAFVDTDADGIADHIDLCANEKGTLDNNGCLSTQENQEPATVSRTQDSQRNAFAASDNADQTATVKPAKPIETAALESSTANNEVIEASAPVIVEPVVEPIVELDSDADGVIDTEDACPDTAGPDKGCPAEKPAAKLPSDIDIDGVADKDDKCPDIAGSPQNAGCPASTTIALSPEEPVTESEEKLIQDAGFNIQFNAGNSVLTGRSLEILLEVAKVLQRYPDISLEAHGFTDAEGSAETNKNLSLQRAQSCIDVIAEAGVNKTRLKALGFGEERPVASNSTAIGRQKNRRVEFKLIR